MFHYILSLGLIHHNFILRQAYSMFEKGNKILQDQPFSRLLGTELTELSLGKAELSLRISNKLTQNYGFVHGGVLSYLADNCITFAATTVFDKCITSEYKISYVRPAIGKLLIARSTVLSSGRKQATCECKIYVVNEEGEKLVAAALGTISNFNI